MGPAVRFAYSPDIWRDFPALVAGVLRLTGPTADLRTTSAVAGFQAQAQSRLSQVATEGELPEVRAWRRAFTAMGLKPTQYRCASEALLRRFRRTGSLPSLHPLVDLCNAASLASAIPIGVFDLDRVAGRLEVRYATGEEDYLAFSGVHEHPEPGEVVFADARARAHARRWTHRQSALSAASETTTETLVVAEAMHAEAATDVRGLLDALTAAIMASGATVLTASVLDRSCSSVRLP